MSLALFGDLSAVSPDKLLTQSQKQLDKLQSKANPSIADKAKIAGLIAQMQVLNGGGTVADAKRAYKDTATQTKEAAKPPIIKPLPEIPQEPETNYKPWIVGGVVVIGGLAAIMLLTSVLGKKKTENDV